MSKSLVERQREYREKRIATDIRISVWISRSAHEKLTHLATTRSISREKVISNLLEAEHD